MPCAPNDVRCTCVKKKMYYASRVYRYRQRFPVLFIVVKLRHSRQIQIRSLSLPREFLIILRSNLRSQDIIIIQQLLKIARTLGTRRVDAIFVLRPSAVPCAFISRVTAGYMSSCPSCTTSAGDRHGTRVVAIYLGENGIGLSRGGYSFPQQLPRHIYKFGCWWLCLYNKSSPLQYVLPIKSAVSLASRLFTLLYCGQL
jgi:hypothetical protein